MSHSRASRSLEEIASSAFPRSLSETVQKAAEELRRLSAGAFVLSGDRLARTQGETVAIADRIHLGDLKAASIGGLSTAAACLLTRSTDGYLRQRALRLILHAQEPWTVPFVVLLLGEYVVEISREIAEALPAVNHAEYVEFVRTNRSLMRQLRARATSYWNCYHRVEYAERAHYPALAALRQMESWAA